MCVSLFLQHHLQRPVWSRDIWYKGLFSPWSHSIRGCRRREIEREVTSLEVLLCKSLWRLASRGRTIILIVEFPTCLRWLVECDWVTQMTLLLEILGLPHFIQIFYQVFASTVKCRWEAPLLLEAMLNLLAFYSPSETGIFTVLPSH